MEFSLLKTFVLLVLSAFLFSCYKEEPYQKSLFACKSYQLDVAIETVDAETNGKKSGDTHFHSNSSDEEVFYSYENFLNSEASIERLKRNNKSSFSILKKGDLKDNNGNKIGEKLLISTGKDYELIWTNVNRFNSVSSKSLPAIEEIEKDCNL